MFRIFLIPLFLLAWSCPAESRTARVLYFFEPDCPSCREFSETTLPRLRAELGDAFILEKRDLGEPANFEAMMAFEKEWGVSGGDAPELFTAFGQVLKGSDMEGRLRGLLLQELSSNQPDPHAAFLANYLKTGRTAATTIVLAKTKAVAPLLLHVFQKTGCPSCDRLGHDAAYLKEKLGSQLELVILDIGGDESKILNEALCERSHVPEASRLTAPAAFFGDVAMVGKEAFASRNFVAEVQVALQGARRIAPSSAELDAARHKIAGRFQVLAWTAILLAGLLDGVNPCAFVTIIFLLSYLTLRKRGRREVALVGMGFVVAVFVTYTLLGLGFLKGAQALGSSGIVRETLRWGTVGVAALLGMLNLRDWLKVRRGSLQDMDLKLGTGARRRINAAIRRGLKTRHLVMGAMAMGALVSVLELACTGQVYLPTVLYIVHSQGASPKALAMLLGYNLAFVAPLLLIFWLHRHGTTDKTLSAWLARHGAALKLGMGLLFLALAALAAFG